MTDHYYFNIIVIPEAILQKHFLSFIGLGVNAPMASWGVLASEGISMRSYRSNWFSQLLLLVHHAWFRIFAATVYAMY